MIQLVGCILSPDDQLTKMAAFQIFLLNWCCVLWSNINKNTIIVLLIEACRVSGEAFAAVSLKLNYANFG